MFGHFIQRAANEMTKTMAGKYWTAFLLICFSLSFTTASTSISTVNGRIRIQIGTSAGCRDAVTFMANFARVYNEFRRYLDVEFIPWGRTQVQGGNLVCQFGVRDCWANRLHRCALNMLRTNEAAQVRFMACEFTRPLPAMDAGSYICAQREGLNLLTLEHCMWVTGDALERPAQQASVTPMQVINFVPFIVFNGNINRDISTQARSRLRAMVCNALLADPRTSVTRC